MKFYDLQEVVAFCGERTTDSDAQTRKRMCHALELRGSDRLF